MIEVVPALPEHDAPLAAILREWDVRECAAFGFRPRRALLWSREGSAMAWTVLQHGPPWDDSPPEPIAMFGVAAVSIMDGIGRPWLLGSPAVYGRPRDLIRLSPYYLGLMRERFPVLENMAHRDNARALTLLRWLGFEVSAETEDVGGEPMVRFRLEP